MYKNVDRLTDEENELANCEYGEPKVGNHEDIRGSILSIVKDMIGPKRTFSGEDDFSFDKMLPRYEEVLLGSPEE